MKENGDHSYASSSGVKVSKLAKHTGCSTHSIRKYTLGEAIPKNETIISMAEFFGVSPGWLLFGTDYATFNDKVIVEKDIFEFIFNNSVNLFPNDKMIKSLLCYIEKLIVTVANMDANLKTKKDLINLSLKTTLAFKGKNELEDKELSKQI